MEGQSVSRRSIATAAVLAVAAACSVSSPSVAREQIRIVGSSTVYPFTTAVAEQFGRASGGKTPVVESTGTGGGMKIFCEGVGVETPDDERLPPHQEGRVRALPEERRQGHRRDQHRLRRAHDRAVEIGAEHETDARQLFLALAEKVPDKDGKLIPNPYRTWSEIDPSLPNAKIEVLGPPPTSGTRDSLHELFLEKGAEQVPALKALKEKDPKAFENAGSRSAGTAPTSRRARTTTSSCRSSSRTRMPSACSATRSWRKTRRGSGACRSTASPPVREHHVGQVQGRAPHVRLLEEGSRRPRARAGEVRRRVRLAQAIGPEGYLSRKGLVTLPKEEAEKVRKSVLALETLQAGDLK